MSFLFRLASTKIGKKHYPTTPIGFPGNPPWFFFFQSNKNDSRTIYYTQMCLMKDSHILISQILNFLKSSANTIVFAITSRLVKRFSLKLSNNSQHNRSTTEYQKFQRKFIKGNIFVGYEKLRQLSKKLQRAYLERGKKFKY